MFSTCSRLTDQSVPAYWHSTTHRSVDWDEPKKAGVCEDGSAVNCYKQCPLANAQWCGVVG